MRLINLPDETLLTCSLSSTAVASPKCRRLARWAKAAAGTEGETNPDLTWR